MMYRIVFLLSLFVLSVTASAAPQANRYGALPEPVITPFRAFAIPFEVLPHNSADPSNEIELLVSTDQGKKWFSAGKTGIEAKQFQFKAENDGEYWFSFRTITLSGAVKQSSASPQLRVIVQPSAANPLPPQPDGSVKTAVQSQTAALQTTSPQPAADDEIQSLKRNKPEYGSPVMPPKPLRLEEVQNKKDKTPLAKEAEALPQVAKSAKNTVSLSEKYRQMPLLSTATGDVIKSDERVIKKNENESVPVEELFSRLNQFYGGKLTEENITPITVETEKTAYARQQTIEKQSEMNQSETAQAVSNIFPDRPQAGKITGVSLNTSGTQPQIIVKWNRGEEVWGDTAKGIMADVLRGKTPQGPWLPLTTNLQNSGEYWWYISQDDITPFYLMIRLRTLDGIAAADFTPSPIQINPKLLAK